MKIQSMADVESEMRKVARGEITSPDDASEPSMEFRAPESITLSLGDQSALAEALINPPEPTAALRRAAQAHHHLIKEMR